MLKTETVSLSEPLKTLPGTWYTSESFIKLAKVKLFDRGWHFLTIINSFAEATAGIGDESGNITNKDGVVQFDFIGNPFFGVCDIHDVSKAAELKLYYGNYKDIKSRGGSLTDLKKVNHVVTPSGLVFVCHESEPLQSFKDYFGGELDHYLAELNIKHIKLRRRLTYECNYNMLTFLDGYQECLHCKFAHPGLAKMYPFESYKVEPHKNFCKHISPPADTKDNAERKVEDDGLFLYFFPSCTFNYYGGGLGLFRCNPISKNKCRMEFEYYFESDDKEKFEEYYQFSRQVQIEDLHLCENTQRNLDNGIYQAGCLHPSYESGVLYYQKLIKERILR